MNSSATAGETAISGTSAGSDESIASPRAHASQVARVSLGAGVFAATLGIVVLVGWGLDVSVLKTVLPGLASMKVNTAVCMLLSGTSLVLWHREGPSRWTLPIAGVFAFIVLIVAMATLAEFATSSSLGIDQQLVQDDTVASGQSPGRMALNTAVGFLAVGAGLLSMSMWPTKRPRVPTVLGWLVAGLGLLAVFGYAAGLGSLTGIGPYASVALHTALGLTALGIGLALARPSRGTMATLFAETPGGQMLRWMLPAAIGVPLTFGVLHGVLNDSGSIDFALASWIRAGGVTVVFLFISLRAATAIDAIDRQRRDAQDHLTFSEQRFRTLSNQAPVGIFETDPDGGCLFVNDRWCELTGLSPEQAMGEGWIAAIHEDDRAGVAAEWTAAIAEGREFQLEYRFLRPDDSVAWVLGSATAVLDSSGDPSGYLGTCSDVTARRLMESERVLQEERFSTAFDHAPIGIALVSIEGHWLRVNRALCDLTGYAEGELLSKTFQEITHPDDLDSDLEHVREMLAGTISEYQMEKRYFRSDGHTIWILLSVSLVRDEDGEPLYFVSQIQDITERKRFERELSHLADHDALTGLFNRRRFGTELRKELARTKRHGRSAALLFIDLDDFKSVNDTEGHKLGDDLIRVVGTALAGRLRSIDVLARLGGDEFGVLLPETDLESAELVAGEVSEAVRDCRLTVSDRTIQITASIGVTLLDDRSGSEDDLLVAADLAMYDAKHAGRDRVSVHDSAAEGSKRATARVAWSERIRAALDQDGFVLHYQPVLDLATDEIGAYEALIRMQDPDGGELIQPGSFLHIAERYGLSYDIDLWVLRHAIEALAEDRFGDGVRITINISARTLNRPGWLDELERLIAKTGVNPQRLIFEITETAAIENLEDAKRFARRLTRLGCELALDDFGTGFSSFYYLKHLPCQYLKIDGEFIRNLRASPNDRLLVKALVGIAKGMHKQTVAEFVGDEETVRILRELGVNHAQGFHISKPLPLEHALIAGRHASESGRSARALGPAVAR